MSSYVKAVDFSAKDALATGNPNKIIKGTELNDEFNAIATAISSKADAASPAFLGNPTTTTQAFGNNSTRLANTAFVQAALQALYPVGSLYLSVIATNPATLFGFGTWVAFGAGRSLVGVDTTDPLFDAAEETGGSKDAVVVSHTHTASVSDPGHTHLFYNGNSGAPVTSYTSSAYAGIERTVSTLSGTTGISVSNANAGVSGVNANLQPYIVVYMWKRTA